MRLPSVSKACRFWPRFLQTMQSDFSGALKQINFQANPSGATQTINQWVAGETDGYIPNLIPAGDITQLTRLVLVNAVYFNADWASPFDLDATRTEDFTLPSGTLHAGLDDEPDRRIRLHG